MLKFRWIPPLRSAGNITFHFTAVPKIPSSYWLKFATQELQVIQLNTKELVQGSTKCSPEIVTLMFHRSYDQQYDFNLKRWNFSENELHHQSFNFFSQDFMSTQPFILMTTKLCFLFSASDKTRNQLKLTLAFRYIPTIFQLY